MARAVQLASDLSQVGLAHHRPPHLWKLRRLGAIAPEGLGTRISHVSSPEGPPLVILPEDTTDREQIQKGITENRSKKGSHRTDPKRDHRNTGSRDGSLKEYLYLFPIHISGFSQRF